MQILQVFSIAEQGKDFYDIYTLLEILEACMCAAGRPRWHMTCSWR